jgi:hypothetical protein
VRVGLAETDKFAEGYQAIFGKKRGETPKSSTATPKKKKKARKKKK